MSGPKKKGGIFAGSIVFLIENSLFLIIGAAVGLVWANVNNESYRHITHYIDFAVNDIAMAFFFLLAGKEIREAMLPNGPLSKFKTAALPVMATIVAMGIAQPRDRSGAAK